MLHFYIHMHSSLKNQNTKEQFELTAKLRGRHRFPMCMCPLFLLTPPLSVWRGAVIAFYFSSLKKNVFLGKCWGLTNSLSLVDGHLSLLQWDNFCIAQVERTLIWMVGARGSSEFEACLRFDLLNIPKLRIHSLKCIQKGSGLGEGCSAWVSLQ